MAWNPNLEGLNNTIDSLNETDIRLKRNVEQFFGIPVPTQVSDGTVKNRKLIIWQVAGLPEKLTIPDLMMKINPQNLSSNYTQLINRKRTFGGFIEEHWGEQLDSLSAQGTTGQFFGQSGLTNKDRRDTDTLKQFEKLVTIYRNNGSVYDDKSAKIISQGSVVMNYDSAIYQGYFETFSIEESNEKQFCLNYNFAFKVTNEVFPGRFKSFKEIAMVQKPGSPISDFVALDITTTVANKGAQL